LFRSSSLFASKSHSTVVPIKILQWLLLCKASLLSHMLHIIKMLSNFLYFLCLSRIHSMSGQSLHICNMIHIASYLCFCFLHYYQHNWCLLLTAKQNGKLNMPLQCILPMKPSWNNFLRKSNFYKWTTQTHYNSLLEMDKISCRLRRTC
jgi:hypothetical protein